MLAHEATYIDGISSGQSARRSTADALRHEAYQCHVVGTSYRRIGPAHCIQIEADKDRILLTGVHNLLEALEGVGSLWTEYVKSIDHAYALHSRIQLAHQIIQPVNLATIVLHELGMRQTTLCELCCELHEATTALFEARILEHQAERRARVDLVMFQRTHIQVSIDINDQQGP